VERVDRAFVDVEDALDLLAAARALVALSGALRCAAGDRETLDGAVDFRRRPIADAAAAGVAAQRGRVDAAAARAHARGDQGALGERGVALDLARELGLVEPLDRLVVAQRGELLGERQQPRDLGFLARLLGLVDLLLGLRLGFGLRLRRLF